MHNANDVPNVKCSLWLIGHRCCYFPQENPTGSKTDLEDESTGRNCEEGPESGVSLSPGRDQRCRATEMSHTHSRLQCSTSPLSQGQIESDISDDTDQELDIEADMEFPLNPPI